MALDTVQDYVTEARTLLQDTVADYRYSDAELVSALNIAFMESRRIRPELTMGSFRGTFPSYSASDMSAAVALDVQYRSAFVYFMCGRAQLRDDESTQDSRAALFMGKFVTQLLAVQG